MSWQLSSLPSNVELGRIVLHPEYQPRHNSMNRAKLTQRKDGFQGVYLRAPSNQLVVIVILDKIDRHRTVRRPSIEPQILIRLDTNVRVASLCQTQSLQCICGVPCHSSDQSVAHKTSLEIAGSRSDGLRINRFASSDASIEKNPRCYSCTVWSDDPCGSNHSDAAWSSLV